MKIFASLLAGSFLATIIHAVEEPTYIWADRSCRNTPQRRRNFDKALAGAFDLHTRGFKRLHMPDLLTRANFDKLFDQSVLYFAPKLTIESRLGVSPGSPPGRGIASWIELKADPNDRNFDNLDEQYRKKSNVRVYCDNDPQETDGSSRWKLWPDRAREDWPETGDYVPNSRRPRPDPGVPPPHQTWFDEVNDITQFPRPLPGQPWPEGFKGPLDAFQAMTAFTLAHEFLHVKHLNMYDQPSPHPPPDNPDRLAYLWDECINLATSQLKMANVNNVVYFSLLSTLRDRQWRLAPDPSDWRAGKLVRDESLSANARRSIEPSLNEDGCATEVPSAQSSGKTCVEFEG
ncbi:MAG: hypothetical protein Q9160_006905 [Pyrenula sp. 1 TL-2023]